jgi:hypothetical protein
LIRGPHIVGIFRRVADSFAGFISGVGFAVDPKNLPSIKKDILEFQDQIISKYSKGKRKPSFARQNDRKK